MEISKNWKPAPLPATEKMYMRPVGVANIAIGIKPEGARDVYRHMLRAAPPEPTEAVERVVNAAREVPKCCTPREIHNAVAKLNDALSALDKAMEKGDAST